MTIHLIEGYADQFEDKRCKHVHKTIIALTAGGTMTVCLQCKERIYD